MTCFWLAALFRPAITRNTDTQELANSGANDCNSIYLMCRVDEHLPKMGVFLRSFPSIWGYCD